jgi:hypothetical protein
MRVETEKLNLFLQDKQHILFTEESILAGFEL